MSRNNQPGFTLLEALIALSLTALLSVAAFLVIDTLLKANTQQETMVEDLQTIERAMIWLDKDFQQVIGRTYRTPGFNEDQAWFWVSPSQLNSTADSVMFIRGGWHNPLSIEPRSTLVRVGYRVYGQTFQRVYWLHADAASPTQMQIVNLLDGIQEFNVEVFSQGHWRSSWHEKEQLPEAVRLTLSTKQYGEITRVYLL